MFLCVVEKQLHTVYTLCMFRKHSSRERCLDKTFDYRPVHNFSRPAELSLEHNNSLSMLFI